MDETPPFALGVSDAGFSRVVAGSTSLVWPLGREPENHRTARGGRRLVRLRRHLSRGGQSGAVLLFVASDGSGKSELGRDPGCTGVPGHTRDRGQRRRSARRVRGSRRAGGRVESVRVADPARSSAERGAGARHRQRRRRHFADAFAARARSLAGAVDRGCLRAVSSPGAELRRWLQAQSQPAVLVSPKGANAGQGSLGAFTGGAATLFIMTTAGHDELWGATLSCP